MWLLVACLLTAYFCRLCFFPTSYLITITLSFRNLSLFSCHYSYYYHSLFYHDYDLIVVVYDIHVQQSGGKKISLANCQPQWSEATTAKTRLPENCLPHERTFEKFCRSKTEARIKDICRILHKTKMQGIYLTHSGNCESSTSTTRTVLPNRLPRYVVQPLVQPDYSYRFKALK